MTSPLNSLIDAMEASLSALLDQEIARVEADRDFLQQVLEGRGDGFRVESVSSGLTEIYLTESLEQFIPIEASDG